MRKLLLVFLVACTPHPKAPTTPTQYACGDYSVMRNGSEVSSNDGHITGRESWSDDAGGHYVTWPATPTDREAIEFVIPNDPRQDAQRRTYDTTFGSSPSDWRLKSKETCTAHDGYNDVLTRYIKGESIDDLTRSLALDSDDETRYLLRRAMASVQHRYSKER